ncbi:MAG: ATP-binding protein [Reichenbachiella sp.]
MKLSLLWICLLFFLPSCFNKPGDEVKEYPSFYPVPQTVSLNTNDGYAINTLTGDDIPALLDFRGDTIQTGVPIAITGDIIFLKDMPKPEVIKAGKPKIVDIEKKSTLIPAHLISTPARSNKGKTSFDGHHKASFIVHWDRDTTDDGNFKKAEGNIIPSIHVKPMSAVIPTHDQSNPTNIKHLEAHRSAEIRSMLKDKNDNIWLGYWGGGVSKYDGSNFTNFTKREGLSSDIVSSILEDSDGNLWFGTNDGLDMYNGHNFTQYSTEDGLVHNWILSLYKDRKGVVWIGTRGGVSKFDGTYFSNLTTDQGLSSNHIYAIHEDRDGNMWFASANGVNKFDGKRITIFNKSDGLVGDNISSIVEDNNGHLWFCTKRNGISKYDGTSFTDFTKNEGLLQNTTLSSFKDSDGNLWFGTTAGLERFDGVTLTHFTKKDGLTNTFIKSIIEGQNNDIWFSSMNRASIMKTDGFVNFDLKEMDTGFILAIAEDHNSDIWFSVRYQGVGKYDGKELQLFGKDQNLISNNINCIFEDSDGNIWFAAEVGGVDKFDGKNITRFTNKQGLGGNKFSTMMEDSRGNIWFGTINNGVTIFDGEKFIIFSKRELWGNNKIRAILEDKKGAFWLAGIDGGVSKFELKDSTSMHKGVITYYTEKEGLSNNTVKCLLEDKKGNIWMGTLGGGISIFDGHGFTHITEKEGLSHNWVQSLALDSNGNVWAGTSDGVTYFELNEKNTLPEIYKYTEQDGLIASNSKKVLLDSKGRIWLGTKDGLAVRNINTFSVPDQKPIVYLRNLEINEMFYDFRNLDSKVVENISHDSVPEFHNYPSNPVFSHDYNHLTFYFSATDLSSSQDLLYSYKIEGLDEHWSQPSKEAKAEYRNMPAGTYIFKVSAIGKSKIISETFKYDFEILPPWWLTWWVKLIYGFLVFGILRVLYVMRVKALRSQRDILRVSVAEKTAELQGSNELLMVQNEHINNQKEELLSFTTELEILNTTLEQKVKERTQKLKSSAEDLIERIKNLEQFSYITSHNLRAPIANILALLSLGKMENNSQDFDRMDLLNESALKLDQVLIDLNKILEIKNRLTESIEKIDLEVLINNITNSLQKDIEENHVLIKKDLEVTGIYSIRGYIHSIFLNLISNAIKYRRHQVETVIKIRTFQEQGRINIEIEDNGLGFDSLALKDKIFGLYQRFHTDIKGKGLGLFMIKTQVESLGGEIEVKSEVGKGTIFSIKLKSEEASFFEKKSI